MIATRFLMAMSWLMIGNAESPAIPVYITIENVQVSTGTIMIAVYDNRDDYMGDNAFMFETVRADAPASLAVLHLPEGNYAVTVFHDVNANGQLDRNLVKLPSEPYGFSNNASGLFGPPSFDDASFHLKDREALSIHLNSRIKKGSPLERTP